MDYKTEYEKKFGGEVSTFGGHAYDGMWMVIEALKAVGPNRAKIRDYLENMKGFVGTAGLFNFSPLDHNGLTRESFEVLTVRGDKFVLAD